jgi:hypothetical protein
MNRPEYDGAVGPWTSFFGGFLVGRPGCYPLKYYVVARQRGAQIVIAFGVGACPQSP